ASSALETVAAAWGNHALRHNPAGRIGKKRRRRTKMPGMNIGSVSSGFGALQNAASGISRASQGISQDAQSIATGALNGAQANNTTSALADLSEQSVLAQISAAALSIDNQTLGTLLNVKA
ncbi:MAG TPA: hypothetical protein VGE92_00795, partial [Steroidobacteraceae bacterium]